jgi:Icc-related predicted phosphoesterase
MLVLAGADFHGSLDHYRWFLGEARELQAEALILAGDLFGYADEVDDPDEDQRLNAAQVKDLFLSCDVPVHFIMGNDDHFDIGETWEGWTPLHGLRVELGRFCIVGYQYSLPWMGGVFEKPEEEIAEDLEELEPLVDDTTILVTHSPAYGILDPGSGPHKVGSRSLRELIDRQRILAHIHGHSHSGFGRTGRHFNVALALRKRAILIELPSLIHLMVKHKSESG